MKSLRLLSLVTSLSLFGFGAFAEQTQPNQPSQQQAKQQRIKELKDSIKQITDTAQQKYNSDDNDPAIRADLDPLVTELATLSTAQQKNKAIATVGAWHQVWSDCAGMSNSGQGALADHVYEVVFPEGYSWTILLSDVNGTKETYFVRTEVQRGQAEHTLTFSKAEVSNEWLAEGADLTRVAMQAELGAYPDYQFPQQKDPSGITVTLQELYVDSDLRVVKVKGPADQAGVATESLMILERQENVGTVTQ